MGVHSHVTCSPSVKDVGRHYGRANAGTLDGSVTDSIRSSFMFPHAGLDDIKLGRRRPVVK